MSTRHQSRGFQLSQNSSSSSRGGVVPREEGPPAALLSVVPRQVEALEKNERANKVPLSY